MTISAQKLDSRLIEGRHFSWLLAALVLFLIAAPLAPIVLIKFGSDYVELLSSFIVTGCFCVVVGGSALAINPKPRARMLVRLFAVVTIALQAANALLHSQIIAVLAHLSAIMFLALVVVLTLEGLFGRQKVSAGMVAASLCVYILLGILWAVVYSLLEIAAPGSFSLPNAGDLPAPMLFGAEHSTTPLYFSFVTLTTLGYGDVTPVGSFGRMLASVEALIGQIYIAVLVARMVGLYIAEESRG